MRKLLLVVCMLSPFFSDAQLSANKPIVQTIQGSIVMPSLLSIEVTHTGQPLSLDNLSVTKTIANFCNINVIGNIPWVVSVTTGGNNLESETTAENIPVEVISLKEHSSSIYLPLSKGETPILKSENDNVQNSYSMDLKISPLENYSGGTYFLGLFFTISPQ